MDEFPDPDEEYDLLHEDEMEALREMENNFSFSKPVSRQNINSYFEKNIENNREGEDDGDLIIDLSNDVYNTNKRQLSVESLNEIDPELNSIEPIPKKMRHDEFVEKNLNFNLHRGTTSVRFPNWPFITFNTSKGERFYVKFNENANTDVSELCVNKTSRSNVLGESYENVKVKAEKTLEDCLQRANFNAEHSDVSEVEDNSDMWVEKYKPKNYLELLSDEGVNRSLLNWLKKWDKVVFNKRSRNNVLNIDSSNEKNTKFNNNSNNNNNNNNNNINQSNDGLDEDGRPHYKIALLCGPPGLGKTTLAHVIAALAGYNVIEVNASDDRSVEVFHTKLEAATQMQSVIKSNKPNCLILDEIDGAPIASVEYLLKYINGNSSSKNKKDKMGVRRPVICICNEPYIPSLRQLRQQAYVVHFPNTSSSRLALRLLEICKKQSIKTDLSTLTLLCDKMQSDIRCCISTLHFFKIKKGHTFKPSDVIKCNIGQKDQQKSLFNLWQEVFQVSMKKNLFNNQLPKRNEQDDDGAIHSHYSPKNMERLNYLVQIFESSGDTERLQQGVYENYLKMKFSQALEAASKGLEWFCWSDYMDTYIKECQNYVLLPYLPYAFAAWHFLFSSRGYVKISFPKTGYESHLNEIRNKQIVSDVLGGLNIGIRSFTSSEQLILDILPMFRTILVPPLRPVNLKLFNEREKKDFHHLLNIMIDYNLNYIQQRSSDGTYYYQLDPNIEEITQFCETAQNRLSFSYNMKQFISREVEMEKVRRTEVHPSSDEVEIKHPTEKDLTLPKQKVPNHLMKLAPKEVNIDQDDGVQFRDFFGRIVTVKANTKVKASDRSRDLYKSKLWFTYKDGFSNAVKKDVTIEYLL